MDFYISFFKFRIFGKLQPPEWYGLLKVLEENKVFNFSKKTLRAGIQFLTFDYMYTGPLDQLKHTGMDKFISMHSIFQA